MHKNIYFSFPLHINIYKEYKGKYTYQDIYLKYISYLLNLWFPTPLTESPLSSQQIKKSQE